jgi:flavin-dependent dehydrogenase
VNLAFTMARTALPRQISFQTLRHARLNKSPFLRAALADAEPLGSLQSVSPVYFRPRRCCGDGFLLVGDAARVTEPVTGEGIYFAMRAGQLAGAAIADALQRRDVSANRLSQYHWACSHEFRRRVRLNKLTRLLTHHPLAFSTLIRFSAKRTGVLDSMVRSVCALR